jgi:hypothetical protein
VGSVSHVLYILACCFAALATFIAFAKPPEPAPIVVNVVRSTGLHVPVRECLWIAKQRVRSGKTKQLGTNSN